jgi:hypothetical protein
MYRDGGFPATQPLHLGVRHGTTIHLYLSERGNWDNVETTIAKVKNKLRKWGFKAETPQYSLSVYGTHDVICVRLDVSDQHDEDRRLTDAEVGKLRKLANPWCKAEGRVAVTEFYLANLHLNTEVEIAVTDGSVTFVNELRPDVGYTVEKQDGRYTFLLATPVGKNAEDPGRAATVVAEALGIYLPERIQRRQYKRQELIIPPFDHFPYGNPAERNFM